MNHPQGLAPGRGHLYVADSGNHAIRDVDLAADGDEEQLAFSIECGA
jgi:hypothetical protein